MSSTPGSGAAHPAARRRQRPFQPGFREHQPEHVAVLVEDGTPREPQRQHGFFTRPDGTRRLNAVRIEPLREVDAWLEHFRRFWTPRLDALATEVARGRRNRGWRVGGGQAVRPGVRRGLVRGRGGDEPGRAAAERSIAFYAAAPTT